MMKKMIAGIDIGGTKCAVILGEELEGKLHVRERVVFPTFGTDVRYGYEKVINKMFFTLDNLLARYHLLAKDLYGVGISCGGPLDSRAGVIMSPPNLPGWDNVKIRDMFEKKYKVTTKVQNDANACAIAEWKYGAGQGYDNLIFLTCGTGMGAGLILDGRLYSGTCDMAGEVGHVRLENHGPVGFGKSGSFEGFCSGGGIAMLARTRVMEVLQMGGKVSFCETMDNLGDITAKVVGDAAEAGDELALAIYRESGQYLGRGIAMLVDILNPQLIIIGSIFVRSRDLLWPHAREVMERECLSHSHRAVKVVPAVLGEELGDFAALSVALY